MQDSHDLNCVFICFLIKIIGFSVFCPFSSGHLSKFISHHFKRANYSEFLIEI